jgi:uncharacterized protein YcbK (DUF882 family)
MRKLTRNERYRLMGLGPHTRKHVMWLLSEYPNLSLSSGRRSHTVNRRVGGSPTSFHLRGRAADFTGPLWDLQHAARACWTQRLGPNCSGPEEVLLEDSGQPNQHLHVAW